MLNALLLSLALSTQGGPTHASLHPAEADLYLELGDATTLLATLDRAPILGFLREEGLKDIFTSLGFSPNRPLKELLQEGLGASEPEILAGGWLEGLGTVSISMVAVGPETDEQAPVALLALADFRTPEQAQALRAAVIAQAPKHEPLASSLSGAERLQMSATAAGDFWCAAIGTRVIVGNAASRAEAYVERISTDGGGLAGNEILKKQLAALEKPSGATLLWFALTRPIDQILAKMGQDGAGGGKFLAQLPSDLNPLSSARVARMQFIGERFVTEMVSSEAPGAESKPVDPAWLEPVPSGSMFVYAGAFDGAAAGRRMRELLAKEEQSAASLAAIEQRLGYGPEKVLARLGPGLTLYGAPPAGPALPEMRAWIDCDDPVAFTSEYEALIGALGETLPGFQAKTRPYKLKVSGSEEKLEVQVTTLTLPPGMIQIPMISLSPSFAPVGKKLVFALSSMDVKNELKRIHSGEGEPIVPGGAPLAKMGFQLPAGARSVFVMDWGRLLASVVGMVKSFAPMLGPEVLPFDVAKLPPSELFTQHFKPTFHYSKGIAGGIYRRNEASFGPETWFGLYGAGALAGKAQQQHIGGAPSLAPSEPAGGGQ